jgi:hypothetical protein
MKVCFTEALVFSRYVTLCTVDIVDMTVPLYDVAKMVTN